MWVLSPGQRVDRYLIEAMIGAGGVAVVYRIRHLQTGTLHALKLLVTDTPSVRKRMRREGRVQFALRHPNIVRVTDVLEIEGRPALIMEYVDGPTLREWLHAEAYTLAAALDIFRVVVRAIGFAHAHGHVHRDLKPSNVLLARTEGGLVPKVADFGIVKTLHGAAAGSTTQQGVFMGTPEYTAPEQIKSAAQVDHRADLFALGCILYEIVCGQLPFVGHDLVTTLNAVRRGVYIEPARLAPDVPSVTRAIHGLLKADPDRRIQSCDDLLEVLEDAPGGARGEIEPPTEILADSVPVEIIGAVEGTWPSHASSGAYTSRPPPITSDVSPTVSAPEGPVDRHPFDEAALAGLRALVHRLTLDLVGLHRDAHEASLLATRYASAVAGVQGLCRIADPVGIGEVNELALDLLEVVEAGRRDGAPLEPSVVDAVLKGMDVVQLRLEAHALGRAPTRNAQRELVLVARVVADLARASGPGAHRGRPGG